MESATVILISLSMFFCGAIGASFTFINKCEYTVWPGVLSNAGWPLLANGGFELVSGESTTLKAPAGWSGRFWGRAGCSFSTSGEGTCASGDCGRKIQCNGAGAEPPATLAEFTLAGTQSNIKQDFYDVSLVDGYNLAIAVSNIGGSGTCGTAGCTSDINLQCPGALQVLDEGDIVGCKSACDAFQSTEYCCQGAYANPSTCKPSVYSQIFKAACPHAYSYAYDDPTSTFTCTGADYSISFCSSSSSKKSVSGSVQPAGNRTAEGSWVGGGSTEVYMTSSGGGGSIRPTSFILSMLVGLAVYGVVGCPHNGCPIGKR